MYGHHRRAFFSLILTVWPSATGSFPLAKVTPGLLPQSNQKEVRLAVFIPCSKNQGETGYCRLLSWGSFAPSSGQLSVYTVRAAEFPI